jgi:enamine deaminase RidA (YjgF/YER057c/UK114 family)
VTERRKVQSGTAWEDLVGYSRAVRVGERIYVSGTTATDEAGQPVAEGDAYRQMKQCLANVEKALVELGGSLAHVVRIRMFVTDITQWREIAKAHSEAFDAIRPCATMVQVSALIDPRLCIEIEVEAEL